MKAGDAPFCSLDQPWDEFSKAWKKTRRNASEKSVHDLRVNARRLIENLELAGALSKDSDTAKLKRRFKKFLKGMGMLRDIQVQLENVSRLPKSQAIGEFTKRLERLERKETGKIQAHLKEARKQKLSAALKEVRSEFLRSRETVGVDRTYHSTRRILNLRHNEFLKAKRLFHRSEQQNEDALHEMRIALKKLRYAMEAAVPMLAPSEKDRIDGMRAFQKLLGDSRDMEMLRAALEEWAKKKRKTMAVVPALGDLQEKRTVLLKKVFESSHELENILEPKRSAPIAEKTRVAVAAAAAAATIKSQS